MHELCVFLLCAPSLLCEGVAQLLRQTAQIKLVGPWLIDDQVWERLAAERPDIILMVEPEGDCADEILLTTQILERYVDLQVIRVGSTDNMLRLFTSHRLPATGAALLKAIQDPAAHTP